MQSKSGFIVSTAAAFMLASALAHGDSAPKVEFHIDSQPMETALTVLGAQSGLTIIVETKVSKGVRAAALSGTYTPEEALKKLLEPVGLKADYLDDKTVAIRSAAITSRSREERPADGEGNQSLLRLAQNTAAADAHDNPNENSQKKIEEIIVTAQKRSERLQDVPVPVTAIDADGLAQNNQLRIQDYFRSVPGLNIEPSIQSNQTLSIRGITTGIGNPTVGVTVDDVPYNASTNNGGGRVVPDIDPGDLARIEVLRGPQGTLYGASSLGGLLKFVTRDPSTDRFSGRVQAGLNGVGGSDDNGYNVRGSVNAPLGDTFAVRASAFTRHDAGYIDNLQTGEDDVDGADAQGARMSALWRPSELFSLKLSALAQQIKGDGASSVDPAVGDLQQRRLSGTGWYERKAQAYSAIVTADLGAVDLTAISGYNINSFSDSFDATFAYVGGAQGAQTLFGVAGAELLSDTDTKKFTQEIRFSASIGPKVEWLLGGFYTSEDADIFFTRMAVNSTTGVRVGRLRLSSLPDTLKEYAAFANLTFHLTDRFDVQIGGRQSEISEAFSQTVIDGLLNVETVASDIDASAFTYLVTPRFRISPDLMVYARLASGYRPGGPNPFPGGVVPPQFAPDKTRNYEMGVKADLLDRTLSIDASVYYIDWKDIQFSSLSPNFTTYFTNGSRAKSQGVELSMESRPLSGTTIAGWVAWNAAELTEPFPSGSTAVGAPGDRLPNSSRFSGNLSVEQNFPLWGEVLGFTGGSVSYVGERVGQFRGVTQRQVFPAYTQVDLRAGASYDTWTVNLFATNVGDERSALYGGLGALPATAFIYIQPRTVGMSVSKSF